MEQHVLVLATGILAVTFVNVIGSVASRKLNFNYGILSIFSLFLYLGIGFWAAITINRLAGISMTGLVALYDAVIGWKLAVSLKPNWGRHKKLVESEIRKKELEPGTVIMMTLLGTVLGWIGSLFA